MEIFRGARSESGLAKMRFGDLREVGVDCVGLDGEGGTNAALLSANMDELVEGDTLLAGVVR